MAVNHFKVGPSLFLFFSQPLACLFPSLFLFSPSLRYNITYSSNHTFRSGVHTFFLIISNSIFYNYLNSIHKLINDTHNEQIPSFFLFLFFSCFFFLDFAGCNLFFFFFIYRSPSFSFSFLHAFFFLLLELSCFSSFLFSFSAWGGAFFSSCFRC